MVVVTSKASRITVMGEHFDTMEEVMAEVLGRSNPSKDAKTSQW